MTKQFCCLLFSILLILFSFSATSKPLKIQVELSEPWSFYQPIAETNHAQYKYSGIWIDIIELLEKQTGLQFQVTLAPHARVIQNLENGKVDVSFLVKTDPANPHVSSLAYMFSVSTIVVTLGADKVKTYDDLYGMRIGVIRGSKNDPTFDSDGALFKQVYRNHKIIVNMLYQNRLDAIVGDNISFPYLANKMNLNRSPYYTFTLRKAPVWIQMSTISDHLHYAHQLLQGNEKLKNSGKYQQILNKYIGAEIY